jgi:hypothetical protein
MYFILVYYLYINVISFKFMEKIYSCKNYNRLTKKAFVLKNVNLDGLMQHPVFLRNDELALLHDCFFVGNTQAKFVLGAYNYFLLEQTTVGKQMLLEATKEGSTNAQYGLVIALLCEFDNNRKEILLSILNKKNGKNLLQSCRKILHHTTLGTKKFRLSNKQECNKNGVGHWDRDFPYPYGNDEIHVTCKRCSVDLESYKLANKLW